MPLLYRLYYSQRQGLILLTTEGDIWYVTKERKSVQWVFDVSLTRRKARMSFRCGVWMGSLSAVWPPEGDAVPARASSTPSPQPLLPAAKGLERACWVLWSWDEWDTQRSENTQEHRSTQQGTLFRKDSEKLLFSSWRLIRVVKGSENCHGHVSFGNYL